MAWTPLGGFPRVFCTLKYPAHAAKEAASRPELRRENLNSCAIPQLITLIEQVGDIKSDADLAVFFRQVKLVQESDIDRIIAGKFIRICEPASQAASIQKIRVHGGGSADVGSIRKFKKTNADGPPGDRALPPPHHSRLWHSFIALSGMLKFSVRNFEVPRKSERNHACAKLIDVAI